MDYRFVLQNKVNSSTTLQQELTKIMEDSVWFDPQDRKCVVSFSICPLRELELPGLDLERFRRFLLHRHHIHPECQVRFERRNGSVIFLDQNNRVRA